MTSVLQRVESEIAAALSQGDPARAAALCLRSYGPEILGFLMSQLRNRQHADEVFSMFAENLWSAMPGLEIKSSMRAYAYALARHAAHRYVTRQLRKERRAIPLSEMQELSAIVETARQSTPVHQRTESKQRIQQLRERLTADEQALLTLRIDRKLQWREIAYILEPSDDEASEVVVARLRKRFEALKRKLTRWAQEEGWISGKNQNSS